jgi:DNA polymerase-1
MKKLLLVDGNSVLFRTYFATSKNSRMTTSSGIPTNAVLGFIRLINKMTDQLQPDAVLVAWDTGKPTFRHEKMEEYKGQRPPAEDDLRVQMPIAREYLQKAGIAMYEQDGYEADDIIGSMAKAAVDMETVVLTSDQDLLQLVDSSTTVGLMKKGMDDVRMMDEKAVEKEYGLKPKQIIDYKALMGDPSDNYGGVKGVGKVTALKLLQQYDTIDGIYEHIEELAPRTRKLMEEGKDDAYLCQEIATIFTDMDIPFSLEACAYPPAEEDSADFYQKYEMHSLMERKTKKTNMPEIEMVSAIDPAFKEAKSLTLLPVADFKPFMEQKLYGFLIASKEKIQFLSRNDAENDQLFLDLLAEYENWNVWDWKSLLHLLERNGLPEIEHAQDGHLQVFLLHSQATSTEDQLEAAGIHLPLTLKDLDKKSLGGFTLERALPVFGAWCWQLKDVMPSWKEELEKEEVLSLYQDVELPLSRVLYKMEKHGIDVDAEKLKEIGNEYEKRMDELAARIYEMAGMEFKINSPKQLAGVLYDELNLKGGGKKRSTAADVLENMRYQHPIIDDILEYRKYAKIVGTYIDGLQKYIIDGRIYTTFNQTAAQTGRLSSSDPNLQNISIKSEEGRKIREAFVAPKDHYLVSSDYSQVELRMLAHMANEQMMIQAFEHGVDIHKKTASAIFEEDMDEVTDAQRRIAKTVNFAVIYGQTPFGLSQELHISKMEAKEFIDAYFESYPNIHRYMDSLIDFCKENGYVKTLLNRRREIPEINAENMMVREFGKRAAMNAPIQGSAADLIKIAMIKMDKVLKERNLKSKMLLQIHDELIFQVPDDELEIMKDLIVNVMDNAMDLHVPLEASVNYGRSWYEAK